MPIFEYECSKCLKQYEVIVLASEVDGYVARCESCNNTMNKLISSSTFQLKGKDWYKPSANQDTIATTKSNGRNCE